MNEEYVIIRANRAPPLQRRGPVAVPAGAQPAVSLDVNVVTTRRALAQAQTDPDVRASARSMPMKLIKPVSIKTVVIESTATAFSTKVAWGGARGWS